MFVCVKSTDISLIERLVEAVGRGSKLATIRLIPTSIGLSKVEESWNEGIQTMLEAYMQPRTRC
jgi:hypothetical protein